MKGEKILKANLNAKGMQIAVISDRSYDDYISLTDIAKYKSEDPAATIQNWMRSRDVIEFLGLWETIHNPNFKPLEFEGLKHGQVLMHLRYRRSGGWRPPAQSVCIPDQEEMGEPLPIGILHSNLLPGFPLNLNYTLLQITNV